VINKKNLLGKEPAELGAKDAIHTAIVAVRAGSPIQPGQRCGPNEHREFVPNAKGPGVADPFRKGVIARGKPFWLLLCQDEIPNVQHVWEHPKVDFSPPDREPVKNRTLEEAAKTFGVTYEQVMEAASFVVDEGDPATYPGSLTPHELDAALDDFGKYDFWSEWADEVMHEFPQEGSACCPEYDYPYSRLFKV
jgi:hypothetical protein